MNKQKSKAWRVALRAAKYFAIVVPIIIIGGGLVILACAALHRLNPWILPVGWGLVIVALVANVAWLDESIPNEPHDKECPRCGAMVAKLGTEATTGNKFCCIHCAWNPGGCRCRFGEFGVAQQDLEVKE